jgi:hypothetical protein
MRTSYGLGCGRFVVDLRENQVSRMRIATYPGCDPTNAPDLALRLLMFVL